ncbi:MAG: hypothetical protein NUV63_07100 [Gallionella sp.]|nr:hypothetical protein [Gallionella sp.]
MSLNLECGLNMSHGLTQMLTGFVGRVLPAAEEIVGQSPTYITKINFAGGCPAVLFFVSHNTNIWKQI